MRILPGSSLVVAPTDGDLAEPELAAGLEESFSGGGYTAKQRAALLQMAWDHVSSALEARESAFELHANGGIPTWRNRLRRSFDRYNELGNAVLQQLDLPMPEIDLSSIRAAPMVPRRVVDAAPAKPVPNLSPGETTWLNLLPKTRDALMRVGTSTLTGALNRRGLRSLFLQDVWPVRPGMPRMVGPRLHHALHSLA